MLSWIDNLFLIMMKLNMFVRDYMLAINGERERDGMDGRGFVFVGKQVDSLSNTVRYDGP